MRGTECLETTTPARSTSPVIRAGIEHEGFLSKDTEVTDIFSPRENFVAGGTPRTSGRVGTRAANPHEKAGDAGGWHGVPVHGVGRASGRRYLFHSDGKEDLWTTACAN